MEFGLSQEQRMLQESVVRFLADASPLERVRKAAEDRDTCAGDVWNGLKELGIPGIVVPEEHGGVGLTVLDAALVAEALGAAVAPVPFAGACVMATLAIAGAGDDAQQSQWLPQMAAGEARIGVGVGERIGAREDAGMRSENGRLRGKALFVIDAAGADAYLVADGRDRLHLVNADAAGVSVRALTTIDKTRSLAELVLEGAEAELLPGSTDAAVLRRVIDAGRVMLSADTLGAAQTMIDKAVAYAKERRQFDRVIGSFQAVKHLCSEMAAELEPCRSLVWYAAYALDAVPEEAHLMACHAKAHLSEVGRFVARTATEVHGGMGFTDLLGLHYWFKRIGLDRQLLGAPELVREEAARVQGFVAAA